jgi:hypothetical protein
MKLIIKQDDKEINRTNFSCTTMPSTKISRDKKFLEITILAEKYH